MINFYRSAGIAPGKQASAMKFAQEVVTRVKKLTGTALQVAVPIGGNPQRIGWSAQYESLAAYESAVAKLRADPKYAEFLAKGADNFVAGSLHDEFWRTI